MEKLIPDRDMLDFARVMMMVSRFMHFEGRTSRGARSSRRCPPPSRTSTTTTGTRAS
jgi:hypothetical protein